MNPTMPCDAPDLHVYATADRRFESLAVFHIG